jgi:biopolymer transport protein ExbD
MRRYSQRAQFSTLSEINITPLLDLAFVLLIIFIITTPLMDKSTDLVIPSSVASKDAVNPASVQTITVDRKATLKLNNVPVALADLTAQLAVLKKTNREIAVVIRSDKELAVQKVIDVMDAVQRAQITKVGMVTNPGGE